VPVLKVIITARAPLVFSERRPDGQFRASTTYVPGVVLRGALAQQFLDAAQQDHADFKRLFTAPDAPLFRNAYPAHYDKGSEGWASARPLPATAYSCKTESGFEKHDVYDGLVDRLCCEQLGVKFPYLPRCFHPDHRGEGERVEAFSGFYADTPQGRKSVSVPAQLTTRVALNRRRKVAEDSLLYSPLVISEARRDLSIDGSQATTPTVFHGSVVVKENNSAVIREWLPRLTHIGSGAARGFGRVEVKLDDWPADRLAQRVSALNQLIRERWQEWAKLPHEKAPECTPDNGAFFAVLLQSDAVLRADGWTPTVRLESELLGATLREATLLRCYATAEYRGGWNTGWRLPKDTEMVARQGSVYVYHIARSPDDEALLSALRSLEEYGVGERRVEGFGQVRVCEEFHQVIQFNNSSGR
jgi:CRISPR-associated protein Csx10